jgi:hypothetical protein
MTSMWLRIFAEGYRVMDQPAIDTSARATFVRRALYLYKTLRLIKLQPTAHSLPRANT